VSRWVWALLIAVYLSVIVITAPASVLSQIVKGASDGRLELANTQGSVWHGVANPVLHQRSGGLITLSTLHWDIDALSIFTGKLGIKLKWDEDAQTTPMDIIVSSGQIELRRAFIPLQAILLDEASDFLKPAALRGQVILRSDSLLVTQQGVQGTATADWLNASSLLSSVAPLGNYHFQFSSSSNGLDIKLSTTSGALILGGQGRFSTARGLDFKGTAQAASGKESALRELLSHLGPEERPGVNTFTLVPSPR
jgi:general secretion pathway protein N